VDEQSRNLVVVELKRGQTSDATVGQVLRYISWVEENVAEQGQKVEGIIIAREIDDALRYAVKNQRIDVLVYKVNFSLVKPTRARELSLQANV
jgi:restriction system protein